MKHRFALYFSLLVLLSACNSSPFVPINDLTPQAGSWQTMGELLGNGVITRFPDMAIKSNGNPVVAWQQFLGLLWKAQVSQWDGATWTALPTPTRDPSHYSYMPAIGIRSNDLPVVAFVEEYLENNLRYSNLHVSRWTGTRWANMGGSLNFRKGYQVSFPSVAIDTTGATPSNYPTIAWTEWNGSNHDARVMRQTATGWQRLGVLDLSLNDSAGGVSLRLDKTGQPVVAWANRLSNDVIGLYIKKWNGTSWESYGDPIALNNTSKSLGANSLALDKRDYPVISWIESGAIKIKRWNGTRWVLVLNDAYPQYPYWANGVSVAVNSANQPVVAHSYWWGTTYLVKTRAFDSITRTWVSYGDVVNSNPPVYTDARDPSLVLQNGTTPIVAFNYDSEDFIAVRQWVP